MKLKGCRRRRSRSPFCFLDASSPETPTTWRSPSPRCSPDALCCAASSVLWRTSRPSRERRVTIE
ncbi:hypothetical protein Dimus_010681 [Dionaea muscipula]